MGWMSPAVIAELAGGVVLLAGFVFIETRVAEPMFRLPLFRVRAFTADGRDPRRRPAFWRAL
jgi:hypothetical protein